MSVDPNSRLKFALARGARIQFRIPPNAWWDGIERPSWQPHCEYRIHPKDEHLAYGPLSTALRDDALYNELDVVCDNAAEAAHEYARNYRDTANEHWGDLSNVEIRALGYLLAEVLADEGV